jgi:hypothetical protein
MQVQRKNFILEGLENLTVEFIENFMKTMGFAPLRWAVVEIKENNFSVEAVVIKKP